MPDIQTWPAATAVLYDDDNLKKADCPVDAPKARSLAEMLLQVSRIEKLKPATSKLLGNFKPREALRAAKERANSGQAFVVCMNRPNANLEFLRPEDERCVYRLANLAARGYVLGTMVFNPDGTIDCYPDADEMELKNLLLTFFAHIIIQVRALDEADKIVALASDENFSPENHEKTLDFYSALTDCQPVTDIHAEITYVNRTPGE